MPHVAVFGVFDALDSAYSLSNVVLEQLEMLAMHGYDTTLFMLEDYKSEQFPRLDALLGKYPDKLHVAPVLPRVVLIDYSDTATGADDKFFNAAEKIEEALFSACQNIDVVITHDILFQTWFLTHNVAMRGVSKRLPDIRWLHWIHSAPSQRPQEIVYPHIARYSGMDNSKYIFLNNTDKPYLAQMLDVPVTDIAVVPNSRDICAYLGMPDSIRDFINKNRLLDAEILIVYPTRMTEAKQPVKAVRIASGLAYAKKSTKIVFANSYSTSGEEKALMEKIRTAADADGLGRENVYFTSDHTDAWRVSCPSECVRSLQQISDVFVLPSISEAHSLIMLEAAICRNLCVLNEDFQPMTEWLGDNALYGKFSSTRTQTAYSREGSSAEEAETWYYRELAFNIIRELSQNKALSAFNFVKRKCNNTSIFKDHIEPLLWI